MPSPDNAGRATGKHRHRRGEVKNSVFKRPQVARINHGQAYTGECELDNRYGRHGCSGQFGKLKGAR